MKKIILRHNMTKYSKSVIKKKSRKDMLQLRRNKLRMALNFSWQV